MRFPIPESAPPECRVECSLDRAKRRRWSARGVEAGLHARAESQEPTAEDAVSRALHQLRGSLHGVKTSQLRRGGGRHIVDEPAGGESVCLQRLFRTYGAEHASTREILKPNLSLVTTR